jgi:pimeloyl-ACP methyl ester carboxylesterase
MRVVSRRTALLGAAVLLTGLLSSGGSTRAYAAAQGQEGSIYLIRGFANVFSRGMDTLSDELRAKGVNSTVVADDDWQSIAQAIEARYAKTKNALPVVLVGHSLGGNSTLLIAAELNTKNIPVALLVNFDATSPIAVPPNVRHVVNFYAPDGVGVVLHPGVGFRGKLENINVQTTIPDVQHVTIEKEERLHGLVIAAVLRVLGR